MVDIIDATQGFSDDDSIDLDKIDEYIAANTAKQQNNIHESESSVKKASDSKWSKSQFKKSKEDKKLKDNKKSTAATGKKKKLKNSSKTNGKHSQGSPSKALQRTGSALDDPDYLPDICESREQEDQTETLEQLHTQRDPELFSKTRQRKFSESSKKSNRVNKQKNLMKNAAPKSKKATKFKIESNLRIQLDSLLDAMIDAHNEDLKSHSSGKPGLAKLTLLTKVRNLINKSAGHGYLSNNIKFYEAISKWLEVNSETKKLPNLTIRTALIELIENFTKPIAPDYLKTNNLGKSLKLMSKHQEETKKNKESLVKMIEKWHSQIFQIPRNFSEAQEDYMENYSDNEDSDGERGFHRSVLVSSYLDNSTNEVNNNSAKSVAEQDTKEYPRARIPESSKSKYKVMPRNDILELEISENSFEGNIQRKERLKKLKMLKSNAIAGK